MAATVSVAQAWAFSKGARVPQGVTADDVVREKEQIEQHLGRLATAEEAAAIVLREPRKYAAHRAFAPRTEREALTWAMEKGVRDAWRSIIRVDVQVTENTTDTGKVEVISKRIPGQVEIRHFHAVPPRVGDTSRVYDSLESIAADPDKEAVLSEDLATAARTLSSKVATVTAELARLHRLRSQKKK